MNPATDTATRLVNGLSLSVRIDRPDAGRPLLLLNGLTRSLGSWNPLVAELADRTVVRFDPPGIGKSTAPLLLG